MLGRIVLYFRTARHLRWTQLVHRPLRRVQNYLPSLSKPNVRPPSAAVIERLESEVTRWGAGVLEQRVERARSVVRGEFTFLNHTEVLSDIRWQERYVNHLWSYNLHYFDYAVDLAWAYRSTGERRYRNRYLDLALSWIDGAGRGRGIGWEPYAASVRIVNWIYAILLLGGDIDSATRRVIEGSIAVQLEHLSTRLEWDVLANHLQKNLKALVVGGMYFGGRSAEAWLQRGSELLWRELFEQVLPDGGQYERSPMYHAISLGDFLEVVCLRRALQLPVPKSVMERLGRMARALAVLTHDDGSLHLFNDSAGGVAPDRAWLSSLSMHALQESIPAKDGELILPETGYYGFSRSLSGERLLIDCGPLGPDYQPGHGHCDLLSFEWLWAGQPVVVDSGVCGYAQDSLREYVRSTRAHNTVSINGREQAELWGAYRVGRRPTVLEAKHVYSDRMYRFEGAYSPYFDRRVVHRRMIERDAATLRIRDSLTWPGSGSASSYMHFHPRFALSASNGTIRAISNDIELVVTVEGAQRASVVKGASDPAQGWYCPEFGVALPAPVLVLEADGHGGCDLTVVIRPTHVAVAR